jgi:hypothetical protein
VSSFLVAQGGEYPETSCGEPEFADDSRSGILLTSRLTGREEVVTSAQFLLDSEASLSGNFRRTPAGGRIPLGQVADILIEDGPDR